MAEEPIALDRVVLRPRLQHLDRAADRGQRRAKLVRRVRDELALGALAALALGHVGQHEHGRLDARLDRDADDAVGVLGVGGRTRLERDRAATEEADRERSQRRLAPRVGQLVARGQRVGPQDPSRRAVRVADREIAVDEHDALVQALEQVLEPMVLGGQLLERLAQPLAHAVDRHAEIAELVAPLRLELDVEVACCDRTRSRADPTQPPHDQDRDHDAGDRADQDAMRADSTIVRFTMSSSVATSGRGE